jgi:hypothetical protein
MRVKLGDSLRAEVRRSLRMRRDSEGGIGMM